MRSRQTTNLLLLLAFLFIFAVILLCLIPSKPSGQPGTEKRIHGSRRYPHRTTSKTRTTEATSPPPSSTSTTTTSTTTTLPKTTTTVTSTTSSTTIRPITTTKVTTSSSTTKEPSTSPSTTTISTTTPSTTTEYTTTPSTSTKYTTTPSTTIEYITSHSSTVESTTYPSTTTTVESTTYPSTTTFTNQNTTSTTTSTSTSTTGGTTYSPMTTESTTPYTSNMSTTTISTTSSTLSTTQANYSTPITSTTNETTLLTTSSSTTPSRMGTTTISSTTPYTTITTSTPSSTSTTTILTTQPTTTMHIVFPSPKLSNVCNSTECKDLSSKMLDSINHATTPCLDFYEYSCGGIAQDDFLVAEDPNVVFKSILNNKMVGLHESSLKNFYETCISTPSRDGANLASLFSRRLKITRENSDFTLIISDLLKSNIAVLFDVTVDLKGDDSSGHTFVPVIIPYSLNVFFPSCVDRDQIVDEERILMSCAEPTSPSDHSSRQCRAATGHNTRLKTIREAAKRFHLFDDTFTSSEQETIFRNVIYFLDEMTLSGCTTQPSHERKITLQDLRELTDLINWDHLFEGLFDGALLETQDIYIRHMDMLQSTFEVFAGWNSSVLQNVFTLLAAEHAYQKEQPDCRTKDHCLEMIQRLLPENVKSVLFEINNPTNELASLTSVIADTIRKSDAATRNASVEFVKLEPSVTKNQISPTSGHVSNIYFLREKQRKDMYRMIHLQRDEITHTDCRFLVRHRQQGCYLVFHKISAPLLYLVPPNFYTTEKIPKFLRLSGIAQYMTKILYEYYTGGDMIYENGQSFYPMEIRNLNQIKVAESILRFSWESIEIYSKMSHREPPEYVQQSLIWLGKDSLKPLNAFLIRRAQALCRYSRDFDCTDRFEDEDFPNDWINSIMRTNLFASAFGCRLPDIESTIRAFTEN